jgi:hypothetical protein
LFLDDGFFQSPQWLVDLVVKVQSNLALVNEEGSGWELVHSDGDMTVFGKDSEEENNLCTRCRTVATFPGITARELCEFFYNPNEKMSWDGTLVGGGFLI